MPTRPIPASIDDVSADWLSDVTGFGISALRPERFGMGIGVSSALYRVRLEGDSCPSSVVVKLPALDEAAVFTSTILRMYIREVGFFNELAASAPVRVPTPYYAAVDPETSHFVVVMEDMGAMRAVDQIAGMARGDAERAVDSLAQWHAAWWGRADELVTRGLTVSLRDPIYPAILPMVFEEGWEKVTGAGKLPAAIAGISQAFVAAIPRMLHDLSRGPNTMIHGDYRGDNILFDAHDNLVLLDFQLIGTGAGVYDLAYLITQTLEPDDAVASEQNLFARWRDGVVAAGVPEADVAGSWDDYRTAALFCLVYPIVASRGMDLDDPRQRALLDTMLARFARAVDDLDLAALL